MILEVIPKSLYSLPNLNAIFANGASSILHKTLSQSLLKKEKYITAPLIVYVIQGKQIISSPNGIETVVNQNCMLFLPKDLYLVSDYVTEDGRFEALLFFYDDSLIDKYMQSNSEALLIKRGSSPNSLYTTPANQQILDFFESLQRVYHNTENTEALLELKLLELLHLIAIQDRAHYFLQALSSYDKPADKRSISDFMEAYYARNLKIEDYALLTGRSVSTFMRDFKKTYNTTPNRWIIEKRLEKAKNLLSSRNVSVTEAALEAGYENVSHFIKAYKIKYGSTPKKDNYVF
ncbi:MAG: AraC family transcriptional regulator [Pseudomonadales bacterium]|uniref:AraC family transcriptional regulator n=2 Tax=Oleiphilus messinensis TaxID=141451 RepID=A0A1Y0I7D7_9GAMM|nr:AraC family transcriptional regulator [Oleiphilus messinensis]MCG8610995.1 AraC family transcriptional regulator [Pseudomonadales bacterium]